MGLEQNIRSKRFQEMQEIAKNYFKSIQKGEEDKKLLEKLREIEATLLYYNLNIIRKEISR